LVPIAVPFIWRQWFPSKVKLLCFATCVSISTKHSVGGSWTVLKKIEKLTIPENTTLLTMDVTSVCTNILHDEGIATCRKIWEQRTVQEPPTECPSKVKLLCFATSVSISTKHSVGGSWTVRCSHIFLHVAIPSSWGMFANGQPTEKISEFIDFHLSLKTFYHTSKILSTTWWK
jgi:hypothetical protein